MCFIDLHIRLIEEFIIKNPIYLFEIKRVVRPIVRHARLPLEVSLQHLRYAALLDRAGLDLRHNAHGPGLMHRGDLEMKSIQELLQIHV